MKHRLIIIAAAAVLAAVTLVSCSSGYSDREIIDAAAELVEKSYDVNVIFFGEGLPAAARSSEKAKKFAAKKSLDIDNVLYLPVSDDSPYDRRNDVMELAKQVYSSDYCKYLEEIAFTGVSDNDTGKAVYARYIEDNDGYLTVKADLAATALSLNRTYDADSIKVVKNTKKQVVFSVQSYVDGEKDEILEFSLIHEADGWRLDTPTY